MKQKGSSTKQPRILGKLSREILGLFGMTAAIAIFFYVFVSVTAESLVQSYLYRMNLAVSEIQIWSVNSWNNQISFLAAVVVFILLFLFLLGQKIGYLQEIIRGVHALRAHRMDYEIPVEGDNEFTELAESINYLARTERELWLKEVQMKEEKEALIRALSHDIRTPLTTILSYSEYMSGRETVTHQEMVEYTQLMQQKAEQIRILTDRLLDGDARKLEWMSDGRLLMEQLVDEWVDGLEDEYTCEIDWSGCLDFSGYYDIAELRRIFDNLSSNVRKYADRQRPVELAISVEEDALLLRQRNSCRKFEESWEDIAEKGVQTSPLGGEAEDAEAVRSLVRKNGAKMGSHGIGIESIRRIADRYDGSVEVRENSEEFVIRIRIRFVKSMI